MSQALRRLALLVPLWRQAQEIELGFESDSTVDDSEYGVPPCRNALDHLESCPLFDAAETSEGLLHWTFVSATNANFDYL